MDKIALFDLDGCLADFDMGLYLGLLRISSKEERLWLAKYSNENGYAFRTLEKTSYWNERMKLIKAQSGWWRNLERIEIGFEILREAQRIGFEINILTKASRNHTASWSEKIEWVKNQPELRDVDIHVVMNKGLVYGTFLYDDFDDYMTKWLEHRPRGLGIMPPQCKKLDHPNVIRWTGRNFEEITEAMQIAYNRKENQPLELV